jgi:Asp-tRNA(Asn)/Glu-tRNA(Gln) amidotransferase C subunit
MDKENKFDLDKVPNACNKFTEEDWKKLQEEIKDTVKFIENMNKLDKDTLNKEYTI